MPPFNLDRDFVSDIQKEITLIDFPLPSRDEVKTIISDFINSWKGNTSVSINVDDNLLEKFIDASIGLTNLEIENCLAKALVSDLKLD